MEAPCLQRVFGIRRHVGGWVRAIASLAIVFSIGCTVGESASSAPTPTASQITLDSGNDQSAPVGTELAMPLVVGVKDASNEPVSGVTVVFEVTDGGGTLSATSATTDALGHAQTTLTVGASPGANGVSATATGIAGPVVFTATGTMEEAARLTYSVDVKPILDAACVSCHATGGSAEFTKLTGYAEVRFGVSATGGAPLVVAGMPASSVLVQKTLVSGSMYASLGPDAAARDAKAKTISDWIAQGALNTPAGPPTQLTLASGNDQSAVVGTELATPLVVSVRDAEDNPVSGVSVVFAVASGGGSLSSSVATTNAMGQAQSRLTLGATAGANSVTVSATGFTSPSITFTANGRVLTYATDIKPILTAVCVSCHSTGGSAQFTPLTTYAQVRFGTSSVGGAPLVVAGTPASSVLVQKTQSTGSMYTSLGPDAASRTANAKLISDWVAQGAFNTTVGAATAITIASGNTQSATAGTALGAPLVVRAHDANDNPVAGVSVVFAVASGGGTLATTTATTNAMGQAQTTLTVGTTAGTNTVTASATGLSPVTFTATGTAGAANQIAIVSGNNQSARVGTALAAPLVVGVKDANGNAVSGVSVAFAVASGGGSLSATTATTNAAGQAQSLLTLGTTAGTNTVTVTRAGLTGSPVTFTAMGTVGTATQIALVSGNNQSTTAGSALAAPFVVAVKDAAGNPIPGFAVNFAVAAGGGTLSAASVVTNSLGQAQTTLTLGKTAGTNTVTANASGLTGSPVTFTATGTAGAATQIAIVSGNNQSATVGTALAMPLVVGVKDANGNPVSGISVAFAVATGGGSLSATTATTNAAGQAQSTLTVGPTVTTNTVTVTRVGLTGSPITFTAMATSGAATQIALVSGNNQSATAGSALAAPFVVVVKDAAGNPIPSFSVTFAVTAGAGTLSAATVVTSSLGQAQTTLTVGRTAGTNTVTANASGLTGSPVTFTATGTAGAATQIALVSGNTQTAPVGTTLAQPLVVGVKDANNNAVSGVSLTFTVASGGGSLSATTVTTNASGQAGSMLTVGASAGSNSVTVTRAGLTGSPVTFTATGRLLTYAADVQPILTARCVSCHMSGGTASFTLLTNYTEVRYGVSFSSGAPLVVPGSPGSSGLVQKTQSGGSMYANLGADAPTRDANAKTISDWVAQGAFNTAVGPASKISLASGNNQSAPAGTLLAAPLVVGVMDANLNPVSGFNVGFAVATGGGSLSATSVATNAQGSASTRLTLGAAAGTNTVNANATGLTGSPVTFTATATAGAYSGAPLAGSTNPFDVAALKALKTANVEPVALSSDGEFLRRVTADLAGRLPTLAEWTAFAASTDPAKRDIVIDNLLASADFGTHWGLDVLAAWLSVDKDNNDATATDIANFEAYLINAATTDKPLSTVASELAQGMGTGGAAFDAINMHSGRRHMAADRLMETFTGIPTRCSQCHDSKITGPTDDPKWTEGQNRGLYKFFQVDAGEFRYYDAAKGQTVDPPMMFVVDGVASNPTNLPLATDSLAVRRARFAQLLVASKAFPRGMGHRIYAEVMNPLLNSNRILAQAITDVKVPDVLAASTSVFTAQGTSLKGYLRVLTRSKLYQLTTQGTTTEYDGILARHPLRRHAAEVLQRGIVTVTGIADSTTAKDDFLSKFGYAMDRSTITERSLAINTIQPLTLLNNPASVPGKVTQSTSVIAGLVTKVDGGQMTLDAAITEIFQRALTRNPTATELSSLKSELTSVATTKEKLEDVAAVVMASVEFTTR
ncbi:MAG: Ig-like domain-containing protein [Deltaproteobacteria bacterium]|nr:Ig-like domain-containing protein [Deltaproteobacteria bacterium]MDQ3296719.1 Ig-like domain-containing protein [Myxococcota bacterium]